MQAVKDSEALRKAVEEVQPLQVKFGLRLSQSRPLYEGFRCACGPLCTLCDLTSLFRLVWVSVPDSQLCSIMWQTSREQGPFATAACVTGHAMHPASVHGLSRLSP